jgi:ribbon-helix-helix CopG family protein
MTEARKLKEVLNVRLDEPLARELRRLAATREQSESEVARWLLRYGIEVSRRLEATKLSQPYEWEVERDERNAFEDRPGLVEIEAKWRPMTDEELIERGLQDWLPSPDWGPEHED